MTCLRQIAACLVAAGVWALSGFPVRAAEARSRTDINIRPIDLKEAAKVSYTRDIKPIMAGSCDECHGADDHKSNFDVSSAATLLKHGKKAGPGVIPGKPDESAIVRYIRGLADGPQMPKGEPPLSEQDLHLIRSWIAAGAVDDSSALAASSVPTKNQVTASADATKELLDAFIFGSNKEQQFAARRAYRLSLVPPAPKPPAVPGPVGNEIDQFIAAKWEAAQLPEAKTPPPVCDDATFIRRIYLDLTGVIPSAEASRAFAADKAPDKRAKWVEKLLSGREAYAAHWTPFWEEALASSPAVGGVATHGNYTEFIYDSFLKNKPYDLMVAELLDPTLPGHQKSSTANANGKISVIGFIRNDDPKDTLQSAANTAQVFLGTGMKCASCHSHFLNKEWPQKRFTAFAGLFGSNDLELVRCEKHSGQFIAAAFPFDLPDAPTVVPQDSDGRLHYLTTLLIDPTNPRFAKTLVNRLWKRYLGLGLFEPVDDFRLDRPASHPELLDWLADDFMRHNYDIKHTIRLILTSRTYQLRYNPAVEDHFNVQKPDEPRYARSPALRRLTAEQFIDSIHEAAAKKWDGRRIYRTSTSTALTRALGRPASRNEISTGRADDAAVVQSLEILNGEELHQFVYDGEILDELASQSDRKKVIDQLYWTVLNRPPNAQELKLGLAYLKKNSPDKVKTAAPVEIVWFDDDLPAGARTNGEAWKWVAAPYAPVLSGKRSHTLNVATNQQQHLFTEAQPLKIEANSRLFTYIYIDPADPPKEIMMQWFQNNWEHRAYWGKDIIEYGKSGEASRHNMGDLPKAGQWVRLEVPADQVGLEASSGITGWSFDQVGGEVYWDKSGVVTLPRNPQTEPLGDMLWALVVSPEFQFIR
jgi:mono/diheme cytochrome c family protein